MLKKKLRTDLVFSKLSIQPGNLLFYALSARVNIRHTVTNANRIRLVYVTLLVSVADQDPGSSAFYHWIHTGSMIEGYIPDLQHCFWYN